MVVDGTPHVLLGVLPADFQFPRSDASFFTKPIDLLIPASSVLGFPPSSRQWWGIGRLAPGATPADAQEELERVARTLASPAANGGTWLPRLAPLAEETTRRARQPLLIVLGISGWDSDNLSDFAPAGVNGITSAAGIIFFSYIGLDAVSTAGEEVKNPRKNLPLAIIFALLIVTGIYILVTVVAVAAQPAAEFKGLEAGLSAILEDVTGSTWPATVLAAGAVISIFSVTLVVIYGQTRILFAMSRDGMIPRWFHRLNPRTLTPVPATIFVAVILGA